MAVGSSGKPSFHHICCFVIKRCFMGWLVCAETFISKIKQRGTMNWNPPFFPQVLWRCDLGFHFSGSKPNPHSCCYFCWTSFYGSLWFCVRNQNITRKDQDILGSNLKLMRNLMFWGKTTHLGSLKIQFIHILNFVWFILTSISKVQGDIQYLLLYIRVSLQNESLEFLHATLT